MQSVDQNTYLRQENIKNASKHENDGPTEWWLIEPRSQRQKIPRRDKERATGGNALESRAK